METIINIIIIGYLCLILFALYLHLSHKKSEKKKYIFYKENIENNYRNILSDEVVDKALSSINNKTLLERKEIILDLKIFSRFCDSDYQSIREEDNRHAQYTLNNTSFSKEKAETIIEFIKEKTAYDYGYSKESTSIKSLDEYYPCTDKEIVLRRTGVIPMSEHGEPIYSTILERNKKGLKHRDIIIYIENGVKKTMPIKESMINDSGDYVYVCLDVKCPWEEFNSESDNYDNNIRFRMRWVPKYKYKCISQESIKGIIRCGITFYYWGNYVNNNKEITGYIFRPKELNVKEQTKEEEKEAIEIKNKKKDKKPIKFDNILTPIVKHKDFTLILLLTIIIITLYYFSIK